MAQIYKIYINEIILILTDLKFPEFSDYQLISPSDFEFESFYALSKELNSSATFLLLCPDFKVHFKRIKQSMKFIKAAGGLVSNEDEQHLFIFRNGKWDLPKGKLELNESSKNAAVREVEEECGIQIQHLGAKVANTYHIYEMKAQRVLKKTAWYHMKAQAQNVLVPQVEEGITDVKWLNKADFAMLSKNTYPLIKDLITKF